MFQNKSRSSSVGSLPSIHSVTEQNNSFDPEPGPSGANMEQKGVDVPNTQRWSDDPYYSFTNAHPLGKILLKMVEDQTYLARKTNNKEMATNIDDVCVAFYNAIKLERNNFNGKVKETVSQVEENLMAKELSAHSLNASVVPPTNFSPVPVINSPQKLTEIMKIFPKPGRFSGSSQKDNHMSVVEFLNTLTAAQNQCVLSEPEFIDRIVAATTGMAHDLVFNWKANGDSASTIYHNLVVNFDQRMSPDDARQKLNSFIVTKNSTLAKAEATIQLLVARASMLLPPGDSRKAYQDMEGCTTLIRALPPYSSQKANELYQNYTTKLQRACTMNELFRGLDQYRGVIDRDIKANGANPSMNNLNKRRLGNVKYNTFYATTDSDTNKRERFTRPLPPPPNMVSNRRNDISYTPKPKVRKFNGPKRPQQNKNVSSNFTKPYSKQIQNTRSNSCSLCGKNHKATECRNIQDDKGNILNMIPTYGVCDKCPNFVKTRLHHPMEVCPYRKGGPFNRKIKD